MHQCYPRSLQPCKPYNILSHIRCMLIGTDLAECVGYLCSPRVFLRPRNPLAGSTISCPIRRPLHSPLLLPPPPLCLRIHPIRMHGRNTSHTFTRRLSLFPSILSCIVRCRGGSRGLCCLIFRSMDLMSTMARRLWKRKERRKQMEEIGRIKWTSWRYGWVTFRWSVGNGCSRTLASGTEMRSSFSPNGKTNFAGDMHTT